MCQLGTFLLFRVLPKIVGSLVSASFPKLPSTLIDSICYLETNERSEKSLKLVANLDQHTIQNSDNPSKPKRFVNI